MNTDAVERLVRQAVAFDVPVHVHISTSNSAQGNFTSGTEELHDFLGLVQRVPEAKYILAHFVGSPKSDPTVVEGYLDIIDRELGGWPRNFWGEIIHFHSPGLPVALARIPARPTDRGDGLGGAAGAAVPPLWDGVRGAVPGAESVSAGRGELRRLPRRGGRVSGDGAGHRPREHSEAAQAGPVGVARPAPVARKWRRHFAARAREDCNATVSVPSPGVSTWVTFAPVAEMDPRR